MNNAIEIKGITKHFPGFALEGLNLTLPSGCILGLIGENGAGKSTTIKLLLGMLKPDGGSASVLGADIGGDLRPGGAVVAGVVLVVFQEFVPGDHVQERIPGDEEIVLPVHLAGAGGAGGGGDGEGQIRPSGHHQLQYGALANAGGAGNDNQLSLAHSGFSSVSSSSLPCQRSPRAWVVRADRITWSVSIKSTARVFRP